MLEKDLDLAAIWGLNIERLDGDADFLSPTVKGLYTWWRSAGQGCIPLRRAFDVTEHGRLAPHLFLVRYNPVQLFEFRLVGEEVLRILGPYSKTPVKDAFSNGYDEALTQYYRRIIEDGRCRRCRGRLAGHGRDFIVFESIDCPLLDETGRVGFILGAIDRCTEESGGQPRRPSLSHMTEA